MAEETRIEFANKVKFNKNVLEPSTEILDSDKEIIYHMAHSGPTTENMVIAYYLAKILRTLQGLPDMVEDEIDPEEFPEPPDYPTTATVNISADELKNELKKELKKEPKKKRGRPKKKS